MHVLVKLSCLDFVNDLFLDLIKSENLFSENTVIMSSLSLIYHDLNLRSSLSVAVFRNQFESRYYIFS